MTCVSAAHLHHKSKSGLVSSRTSNGSEMAAGGMILVKYLLFVFNFIFWLSGLALIIVGGIIKVKYGDFIQVTNSSITTAPIFLIIIGVIIAIVGFLGCCGAYKENYCMITTFAVLLAIIFILEIAAGALAYAYKNKLEDYARNGLQNGVDEYGKKPEYKKAMDNIQKQFKCCGVNGYKDYMNQTQPINSCCPDDKCIKSRKNETAPYNYFKQGCVDGFKDFMQDHLVVVGGVGIGLAFIQLIGIIFSCCLMRSIKAEYEVM